MEEGKLRDCMIEVIEAKVGHLPSIKWKCIVTSDLLKLFAVICPCKTTVNTYYQAYKEVVEHWRTFWS